MTATHVRHATEICGTDGPTGEFAEVLEGEIQDYGRNVLFAGTADQCASRAPFIKTPTRLVPTKTRTPEGERIVSADTLWSLS